MPIFTRAKVIESEDNNGTIFRKMIVRSLEHQGKAATMGLGLRDTLSIAVI
jgi:hypothetical protein